MNSFNVAWSEVCFTVRSRAAFSALSSAVSPRSQEIEQLERGEHTKICLIRVSLATLSLR